MEDAGEGVRVQGRDKRGEPEVGDDNVCVSVCVDTAGEQLEAGLVAE